MFIERFAHKEVPVLSLFGRYPLLFYVSHVALIHGFAWCMTQILYGHQPWENGENKLPDGFQPSLSLCYGVWLAFLALMVFLLKRWEQHRHKAQLPS